MGLFDFNKKLKREKLVEIRDLYNEKIKNSNDDSAFLEYFDVLEREISKYKYHNDKRFVSYGRVDFLIQDLDKRLLEINQSNDFSIIQHAYFNLDDVILGDYHITIGSIPENLDFKVIDSKNEQYYKDGYICQQEKDIIINMISKLKKKIQITKYLNKINFTIPDDAKKIIVEFQKNKSLHNAIRIVCDVDFQNDDILYSTFNSLIEFAKSNYDIIPIAVDPTGGIYGMLDNYSICFISSEGECGIIANDFNNFIILILNCGMILDFCKKDIVNNKNKFIEVYNDPERVSLTEEKLERGIINEFISKNNLLKTPSDLYEIFKNGVISDKKLKITAISNDYEDYTDLIK